MKKRLLALLLVLCTVFIFVGCKDKDGFNYDDDYKYDGASLVGKWQNANPDHASYSVYEFEGGGKYYNSATVTTYIYGIEAVKVEATYRVEDGNTLVIDYDENLSINTQRYKFSISDGKVYINDQNKTTLEKYNLNYNQDTRIFGTWRDTKETDDIWQMLPDYSGLLTDKDSTSNMYFSTEGNILNVFVDENFNQSYGFSPEYVLRYEYSIEENILTLKIDGKTYTLERQ